MTSRFCERCERVTRDGHLWCPDNDCPAERGFPVFDYGDYVGDWKITKLVRVWRSAALYTAQRGEKIKALLKVAHADPECEERLKREAQALESMRDIHRSPTSLTAAPRPLRLQLLPPYPIPSKRYFGEITIQGEPRIFSAFNLIEGKLLSDLILEIPQLWHYEAAWITQTVIAALQPLTAKKAAHLNLTPDMVMVEPDKEGHWRATLLDLGWIATKSEDVPAMEWLEPAYAAPEVLNGRAVSPAADVYSLGLILYEMLAGKPGYEPKLYRDEIVTRSVVATRTALAVERPELEQAGVVKVVQQSIGVSERYPDLEDMGRAVAAIYSTPPREKRPLPTRTRLLIGVALTLLVILVCAAAYLLLQLWLTP